VANLVAAHRDQSAAIGAAPGPGSPFGLLCAGGGELGGGEHREGDAGIPGPGSPVRLPPAATVLSGRCNAMSPCGFGHRRSSTLALRHKRRNSKKSSIEQVLRPFLVLYLTGNRVVPSLGALGEHEQPGALYEEAPDPPPPRPGRGHPGILNWATNSLSTLGCILTNSV
jgi:hypothetical protein